MLRSAVLFYTFTDNWPLVVMKEELEGALKLCGITSLDEACPELVNTSEIDHLAPDSLSHPYARAVARGQARKAPSAKLRNGGSTRFAKARL